MLDGSAHPVESMPLPPRHGASALPGLAQGISSLALKISLDGECGDHQVSPEPPSSLAVWA